MCQAERVVYVFTPRRSAPGQWEASIQLPVGATEKLSTHGVHCYDSAVSPAILNGMVPG